ncbi:MAG: 50S ribosomal protein L10 [Desulfobacterales bacterium]|nr:50S ribosomal protein L10 [Desulfobacterales bacterium]
MKLEEKKQLVDEIHATLANSSIVVLTNFKGIDVKTMSDLRGKLKSSNVYYKVLKNTLLYRAVEGTHAIGLKSFLIGPNAIAVSSGDPVSAAKILYDFTQGQKNFEIRVGALNGKILNFEDIKELSSLPSREVLLSKVLSAMIGVPTALVMALNDVPRRLINVLVAIKKAKEEA